jgi:pimeloyl-ACP methyl ester carboxylesterase
MGVNRLMRGSKYVNGSIISSRDGLVSGLLVADELAAAPLLVCIHGGGCNAGYFAVRGHSTLEAARQGGFSVLLLNRPGYGGNPPLNSERPVQDGVAKIRTFIEEVLQEHLPGVSSLHVIGHSIGGATALELAAEPHGLPLCAVAVSSISDKPVPAPLSASGQEIEVVGGPDTASLFLGERSTYSWRATVELRKVSETWHLSEILEMVHHWSGRWQQIAPKITVPVHLRLAEQDRLFFTGVSVVKRMAAVLSLSTLVDADLLLEGGHVYELHRRGPELIAAQIAFLKAQAAGADLNPRQAGTGQA